MLPNLSLKSTCASCNIDFSELYEWACFLSILAIASNMLRKHANRRDIVYLFHIVIVPLSVVIATEIAHVYIHRYRSIHLYSKK